MKSTVSFIDSMKIEMWFYHYYFLVKTSSEDETMKQIRVKSGSVVQLQLQREDNHWVVHNNFG